jgi:hypothetical protein
METGMLTLRELDHAYYTGDHGDWPVVMELLSGADALTRSNFRVILNDLAQRFPEDVHNPSLSEFRWGYRDLVALGSAAALNAFKRWKGQLEQYPVADDEDFSDLEEEEREFVWLDRRGVQVRSKFGTLAPDGTMWHRFRHPDSFICPLCEDRRYGMYDEAYISRGYGQQVIICHHHVGRSDG